MIRVMSEKSRENYLGKGDAIVLRGWFRSRLGVCLNNFEVLVQGWFGIRLKKLKKYAKRRKIYRDGKLIKYVRF